MDRINPATGMLSIPVSWEKMRDLVMKILSFSCASDTAKKVLISLLRHSEKLTRPVQFTIIPLGACILTTGMINDLRVMIPNGFFVKLQHFVDQLELPISISCWQKDSYYIIKIRGKDARPEGIQVEEEIAFDPESIGQLKLEGCNMRWWISGVFGYTKEEIKCPQISSPFSAALSD